MVKGSRTLLLLSMFCAFCWLRDSCQAGLPVFWYIANPNRPTDAIGANGNFFGNKYSQQVVNLRDSNRLPVMQLRQFFFSLGRNPIVPGGLRFFDDRGDGSLKGTRWHVEPVVNTASSWNGMYMFNPPRQETEIVLIQFYRDRIDGGNVGLAESCQHKSSNHSLVVLEGWLMLHCHSVSHDVSHDTSNAPDLRRVLRQAVKELPWHRGDLSSEFVSKTLEAAARKQGCIIGKPERFRRTLSRAMAGIAKSKSLSKGQGKLIKVWRKSGTTAKGTL